MRAAAPALALRVLGGHRREPPCLVRSGAAAASPAAKMCEVARDGQEFIDHDAPMDGFQPERLGERPRRHADAPDDGVGGHGGPAGEPDPRGR